MLKCRVKNAHATRPSESDVAERADVEQRAAAQPVNQPEADEGEDQIRDADADGLQQRGFRAQAGHLEDARREVKNRVDARELVKERDQDGQQDRNAQLARSRSAPRTARSEERGQNLVRVGLDLRPGRRRARSAGGSSSPPRGRLSAHQPAGLSGMPKHINV